jgi:hypothetical protein
MQLSSGELLSACVRARVFVCACHTCMRHTRLPNPESHDPDSLIVCDAGPLRSRRGKGLVQKLQWPAPAERRRTRTDRGGAWRGGLSAESEARRCGDDFCASSSAGRCPALVSCLPCLPVCRSACAETLSLCVCVCGQDIHVYAYMGTICLSVRPSVCVRNTCSHRRGCEGAWVGVLLVRPPRIESHGKRLASAVAACCVASAA